ncbi:HDOD domain-containing protein [Thiorhodococcus mannitoliphagus]|uniref:HDOD domain-containing protein n=1 Tax=Thiorhodococcus mannitoliphagus TaxID=329406 RepID=A0A6P1DVF4_9GAMM|nr:HDOD domain-containing protein [Thiorhodococcus mannitoliphagus]NEX22098.1 HDOD domain-containing protein [Thiorhodococcus mannitoliphagus]
MPDVVFALRDEFARDEPDLRRAGDLIGQDPALTGQVLKTINSPFFYCPTKISSVQRAVSMMGLARLANLVTAEALKRILDAGKGPSRVVSEAIMEQLRMASAVAGVVKSVAPDEAYLLAMMQDVGCLIFAELVDGYGSEWLLRAPTAPRALLEYERGVLGVDHVTVGFLLAGNWRLPDHLALAIYHHHVADLVAIEDPATRALIALSRLSTYLASISDGAQDAPEMQDDCESARDELAVAEDDWARLCELATGQPK